MSLTPSTVYVVFKGEAHEGGEVQGVFSTEQNAVIWCKGFIEAQTGRHVWEEKTPTSWRRGCDELSVEAWEVDKS
jgi:hypothetical protein